jgi:GntR family transcriptional regulator
MEIDNPGRPGQDHSYAIWFRLDPASGVPTYLQLVQQVEHALRLGSLRKGDQLPRVKDVVGALSINPNTVLKAYRELERRGLAAGHPGFGTFIETAPPTIGARELMRLRRSLMNGWLREAARAGLDAPGTAALFEGAWHEFWSQEKQDRAGTENPGVVA